MIVVVYGPEWMGVERRGFFIRFYEAGLSMARMGRTGSGAEWSGKAWIL